MLMRRTVHPVRRMSYHLPLIFLSVTH